DLTRTHLDDKTAEDRRIDGDIDRHVLAGHALQRCLQFVLLRSAQLVRGNHIGGDFATMFSSNLAESGNDAGQCKETAVPRDDAQEISNQTLDACLVGNGADGVKLVFRGKHRTGDQSLEVFASAQKRLETVKIFFHSCNGFRVERELEKRSGVTLCDT